MLSVFGRLAPKLMLSWHHFFSLWPNHFCNKGFHPFLKLPTFWFRVNRVKNWGSIPPSTATRGPGALISALLPAAAGGALGEGFFNGWEMERTLSRAFPPNFSHFMGPLRASILFQISDMLDLLPQLPLNPIGPSKLDPKRRIVAGSGIGSGPLSIRNSAKSIHIWSTDFPPRGLISRFKKPPWKTGNKSAAK